MESCEEGGTEILLGDSVLCGTDPVGKVTRLVIQKDHKLVRSIVVSETRRPHLERIVGLDLVWECAVGLVYLRCSRQELASMPSFLLTACIDAQDSSYAFPAWDDQPMQMLRGVRPLTLLNLQDSETALDADTRIRATDGNAGRLSGLGVDHSSGDIQHLVMRLGQSPAPERLMIPAAAIAELGSSVVYLRVRRANMASLPHSPEPRVRLPKRYSLPIKRGRYQSKAALAL